jgi:hypothetical protein
MCTEHRGIAGLVRPAGTLFGVTLLALAAILGCSRGESSVASKSRLEERVAEYWAHKIDNDLIRVYEMYEPAFREKVSLQDFLKATTGAAVFVDSELDSVDLRGKEATVSVTYRWHMSREIPGLDKITPPTKTVRGRTAEWVWVDGEWYRKAVDMEGSPLEEIVEQGRRRKQGEPTPEETKTNE